MKTWSQFLRALWHPGPIATICLIKTILAAGLYCSLLWWPPHDSIGGFVQLSHFLFFSGLTMFHFFASISVGPGYIPKGWKPADESNCSKLQYCTICNNYKAPRSHHCRQCKKCVMKMDHHCPWINECVGHHNHSHFVMFLISAVVGCSQACYILGSSLYYALYRPYFIYHRVAGAPILFFGFYTFVWILFSLGCAFGVTLGVGGLLYYQLKVVLRNQTSIEDWIVEKANYRRKILPHLPPFVFPYNFGWFRNWCFVMKLDCIPDGNGIYWPVLEGCNQFTLTEEQLQQKDDKRRRVREFQVVEEYGGSWLPITKGIGTLFHPPCSDESRIPLKLGQVLLVSRWKKYWLYGEIVHQCAGDGLPKEIKGWFPRRCAQMLVVEEEEEEPLAEEDQQFSAPAPASKKDN